MRRPPSLAKSARAFASWRVLPATLSRPIFESGAMDGRTWVMRRRPQFRLERLDRNQLIDRIKLKSYAVTQFGNSLEYAVNRTSILIFHSIFDATDQYQ